MKVSDFTRNPHYFLAAYTVRNAWVLWALSRNGLLDTKCRVPCEDDVLEPETLALLPRRITLSKKATHP